MTSPNPKMPLGVIAVTFVAGIILIAAFFTTHKPDGHNPGNTSVSAPSEEIQGNENEAIEKEAHSKPRNSMAENEAIEKEAHSTRRNWIHVIFGKYDGRCEAVTTSARAHMEANHPSGFTLAGADKYNDAEYAVEYRTEYGDKDYIFVTSLRLCEEIIQHNVSK